MNSAIRLLAFAPQDNPGILVAGAVGLVLVGVALWVTSLARRARAMTFQMQSDGLHITAPLYGKVVPKGNLKIGEARVLKLSETPDLQPTLRTNGLGLPGIHVGWFKLRNGTKGLVYVAKTDSVVAIPSTEGYTLLLGSDQPDQLLASLRT